MNSNPVLKQYRDLVYKFLSGGISVQNFECQYLKKFKEEKTNLPENEYLILNELFISLDAYCADPALRDEDDIDDVQLMEIARKTHEKL